MYELYPIDDEYYLHTGSAYDCTGLIPSAIDDDEIEMYEDLYPYLPTVDKEY